MIRAAQSNLLRLVRAGLAVSISPPWGAHDVDGRAGPRTRAAVAAFQRWWNTTGRNTLRADGVLDEETAAMLEREAATADDAGAPAGGMWAEADAALRAVRPDLNAAARQILLGHAYAESRFGYAFRTPDGSPSHNWGAIYADGDRGRIPVQDTNDGKPFTAGAAWNSSAEVGARQFVNLIAGPYSPALARAAEGDVWGYARALWRDGPGSTRPPYFGGFPPGHKWSLAPAGTPLHSAADHYWRITAYARMVMGGAREAAKQLGEPLAVRLVEPPAPGGGAAPGSTGGGAGALVALLGLAYFLGGLAL